MNKTELVNAIAEDTKLTKKDTQAFLKSFLDNVEKSLKNDDSVQLIGFGTFSVGKREARSGRNPKTGATMKIAASKYPKFKAGASFKASLNDK
ncbi:MAG: HU family DNA-binding protein [Treponema sp.]|nr:HU family DNA-binding protein [Treponema sp.]